MQFAGKSINENVINDILVYLSSVTFGQGVAAQSAAIARGATETMQEVAAT